MECFGKSDIGMRRSENQDTFLIKSHQGCTVAVVCDGMGGEAGGKLAAEIGSSVFMESFFATFEEFCTTNDSTVASVGIPRAIKNAVKVANKAVYERSLEHKELRGMGTTLVGAVFYLDTCYAVNVGDSRLYQLDYEGSFSQITKDHTYIEFLMQNGKKITKRIEKHEKGVITRALGPDQKVVSDVFVFEVNQGDKFLLCSDGLYNMTGNEIIEKELSLIGEKSLEAGVNDLVDLANLRGGTDNITAVIIKI